MLTTYASYLQSQFSDPVEIYRKKYMELRSYCVESLCRERSISKTYFFGQVLLKNISFWKSSRFEI